MSFDALALHYWWIEGVCAGNLLQRCRTAFLPEVEGRQRALIIGEGNGRFLVECRRRLPSASITVVDSSECMLELARRRLARSGLPSAGVQFVHADALLWKPAALSFDLVVTHFFLDCFPAPALGRLIEKIASAAVEDAGWLLADFTTPASGLRRWRAQLILWSLYRFFRLAAALPARRLTPPDELLRANGFQLQRRRTSDLGLLHTDIWRRRGKARS